MLKTFGYLFSTVSAVLLGVAAWQSVAQQPSLLLCLVGGMTASVGGMFLRWLSHHRAEKRSAVGQLAGRSAPGDNRAEERGPTGTNPTSVVARRS